MIKETAFIGCENLPSAMADKFDRPWHFIGEVRSFAPFMQAYCKKCRPKPTRPVDFSEAVYRVVDMDAYLFVTDDMLEVTVYFGICNKCDAIYWARQGPPFKRVRACIYAD